MLFRKTKNLVGLDIGSSAVKLVELKDAKGGGYRLVKTGLETLSPEAIVDGAIMDASLVVDTVNRIIASLNVRNSDFGTSLSGHSVIIKKISLPAMSAEELAESIRWEAEQYIPFDIGDVNLDYQVLGENSTSGNLDVLLVAVKKEKITDHTSVITMAGKTPVVVDVDAFALLNAYEVNYRPSTRDTVALLDIGASVMTINIVSGTDFLFTRDVGVGGNQYTDFLQKEFNLSYEKAQALKHGEPVDGIDPAEAQHIIDSVTEIICLEIQKTFDFVKSTTTIERVDRMLISGGASHTPNLIETLGRKFGIPAECFDSFKNVSFDPKQFPPKVVQEHSPDLAIAIGLALRSADE